MSQDELRERIKNELVLHEGNIADWQWNRTGLPTEAIELGITDFPRLVEDVSRPLNARFSKILDLQAAIQQAGTENEKHLSSLQIDLFAQDADRLGLSRTFVTEQWIPQLLAKLPDAATMPTTTPPNVLVSPTSPPNVPGPSATPNPAAAPQKTGESAERMQQKVRDILDDYKEHIPANAIRGLFRAIDYDETVLAEAVKNYLSANFYAAESEPVGQSLRDKLTSTDWRHLAWWDRPASPPVSPPPPVAAVTPPLTRATVPPVVEQPTKKSTGLRDFMVALLIAGGLIGFVVVLVRSQQRAEPAKPETSQTKTTRPEPVPETTAKKHETKKERRRREAAARAAAAEIDRAAKRTLPAPGSTAKPAPKTPADEYKAYDQLLNDVGQYGERQAKKDGQWGLWRKGQWLIQPEYDDITVFNNGRATVTNNGHSYEIDRFGDRVK